MSGQRFKNIYRAVLKIFEEVLNIKNYPKIIVGVIVRKSLVLEIAKKKTNKTFMASKYTFKTPFGII